MRTKLAKMHDRLDKNMIYVTHDQIAAMTLGDRIVVNPDGVVQQQGTPQELFEIPVNKFVVGFIGTPTMNAGFAFQVRHRVDRLDELMPLELRYHSNAIGNRGIPKERIRLTTPNEENSNGCPSSALASGVRRRCKSHARLV